MRYYRAESGPCDPPAEQIAIALTDRDLASTWVLDVYVTTSAGRHWLGTCTPSSPTMNGILSRIVAVAGCPGAQRWEVIASSETATAPVSVAIVQGHRCCGAAGVELVGRIR